MRQQPDMTAEERIQKREREHVMLDLERRAKEKLRQSRPKRMLRMFLIICVIAALGCAAYYYLIR